MFKELKNEAKISFLLHTRSPLTIHSTQKKILDPTALNMQCIKSRYQGEDTVLIPGSSLKGVIRSRYEKIIRTLGGRCCNIFDKKSCGDTTRRISSSKVDDIYKQTCYACRLFGSTKIASRIYFADAYPVGDCVMGERAGIGINRITGAVQNNALYDFEVVEDGVFQVKITLKNYEIYQLLLLMYVFKDLNDGYVSLGAASSRGNGQMEIKNLEICFREYRENVTGLKGAVREQEIFPDEQYGFTYIRKVPFYGEMELKSITLDDMFKICKDVDIQGVLKEEHQ